MIRFILPIILIICFAQNARAATSFTVNGNHAVAPTNLALPGWLSVTNPITNQSLTASTILKAGSGKGIESLATPIVPSVLTNDITGLPDWFPISNISGGSGSTNIFNPNQFTQVGVGGTNVNIKSGALVSNLFINGQTNFGTLLVTNPIIKFFGAAATTTLAVDPGNSALAIYDNLGDIIFTVDDNSEIRLGTALTSPVFPALGDGMNTFAAVISSDQRIATVANAKGRLNNDGVGLISFLPLSVFSNNVLLTETPTNFDFYGFLRLTNAAGKVSIGAPDISTGSSNSYTFDTTQFARTGTGGTNITLKSGFQGTNAALFGLNTNNGSMDTAGGVTNWSTTRLVGAVEHQSTTTNTGAINNAAGVTNWSNTLLVGAVESRSTSTNTGSQNNAAGVTNWSNVLNVGAVENRSTTTNTGAINNAAGVTNWSNLRTVGANENQSTVTNTGAINNAGPVTNWNLTANTVMSANAGKQEASIANPSIGAGQPLIFNGTNSFFQEVDDGWWINDEFNMNATVGAGTPWITLLAATAGGTIKTSSTNWGELTMTNGPTAADRMGGANPNLTATYIITNTEIWCWVRVAVGTANSAKISNHFAFGIGDTFSGQTSNGFWVQQAPKSTVWQAVTANAGAVTTNSLTIAVTVGEWREFGWHLDTSQTAVYFYSGNRVANSTIWCTNSGISLPIVAMNPFFSSRRMATQTSGSATNSVDHFKIWKRNLL